MNSNPFVVSLTKLLENGAAPFINRARKDA